MSLQGERKRLGVGIAAILIAEDILKRIDAKYAFIANRSAISIPMIIAAIYVKEPAVNFNAVLNTTGRNHGLSKPLEIGGRLSADSTGLIGTPLALASGRAGRRNLTAVEIEPQRTPICFIRHGRPVQSPMES